ncbi:MAG TPA: GNAT family N-acetyltransferase [Cytophagales bacterium]|nr:GNAT family N-acetyltransferase [Cytophagales bacterium]
MNLQQVNFSFITTESSFFEQILDLRYKTFFEPFQLKRSIVQDELEDSSLHLLASKDGNVMGYLRVTLTETEAFISQMIVDPSCRKQGLGKELITLALEKIKALGLKKVILDSRLNALKFYEKQGFQSVGNVFSSRKTGLLHMKMEKALV